MTPLLVVAAERPDAPPAAASEPERAPKYSVTLDVGGPHRSADGTVTFPLYGLSGTPHTRVGYAW